MTVARWIIDGRLNVENAAWVSQAKGEAEAGTGNLEVSETARGKGNSSCHIFWSWSTSNKMSSATSRTCGFT